MNESKKLRRRLLAAQLAQAQVGDRGIAVVLSGHTATVTQTLLHRLDHWLENRATEVHALEDEACDHQYPPMWRFWRRVPALGRVGVFIHGWYQDLLFSHVEHRIGDGAFNDRLGEIARFEASLSAENVSILKIWIDSDQERELTRMKQLASDPATAWQCTPERWIRVQQHTAIRETGRRIRDFATDGHILPWQVIDDTALADALPNALLAMLEAPQTRSRPPSLDAITALMPRAVSASEKPPHLGAHAEPLDREDYETRLATAQGRLGRLLRRVRAADRSLVLVFEGADAAGKGGTLHRMTGAMDPRHMRVHSISAPSDDERAHPWLWRFWTRLPRRGRIALFDRSWYGRVLVERVEGLAAPEVWQRAYGEIREFERQIVTDGAILAKFLLDIDADTQLQRFIARRDTPHKRHKLTDEDWRNRERWNDYQEAFTDLLRETHAPAAPWYVIPAQCKRRARIDAIERLCTQLEATLGN
ncbi:MAG: polyphosphate:AMP phosphotransferase [Thioalkalivibrionaceae bacterium]